MTEVPAWKTPIAEDCFMIGRRDQDSILQCNTYLRTFRGKGSPVHWCVDPGSRMHYPDIRRNLLHHIGEMKTLRMFSINHQDPDVVGNAPEIVRENPRTLLRSHALDTALFFAPMPHKLSYKGLAASPAGPEHAENPGKRKGFPLLDLLTFPIQIDWSPIWAQPATRCCWHGTHGS
jgi:hypothetical protein